MSVSIQAQDTDLCFPYRQHVGLLPADSVFKLKSYQFRVSYSRAPWTYPKNSHLAQRAISQLQLAATVQREVQRDDDALRALIDEHRVPVRTTPIISARAFQAQPANVRARRMSQDSIDAPLAERSAAHVLA